MWQRDDLLAAFRDDRGPSEDAVARMRKRLNALGPVQERARVIELPSRRTDRRVRIAVAVAALAAAAVLGWWVRGVTLTPAEAVHGSLAEDRVEGDASADVVKEREQARVTSTPEPVVREIEASNEVVEAPAIDPAIASPRVPHGKPARARAPLAPVEVREEPPAVEPPHDTLAAETAIVRRARAELSSGNARSALTILAEHRQQFPTGTLVEEAAAVRAMANCRVDQSGAARVAAGFADRFPKSLFRGQVAAACRPAEKTDAG